jgi:tetratricopeptide (TPR) repeat protein
VIISTGHLYLSAYRRHLVKQFPVLNYPQDFTERGKINTKNLILTLCAENADSRDIFFLPGADFIPKDQLVPKGLLYKYSDEKKRGLEKQDFYLKHLKLISGIADNHPDEEHTVSLASYWLYNLGDFCDYHYQRNAALELYLKALEINKTNVDLRLRLAANLARNEQYKDALKYVAEVLDIDSRNQSALKLGQKIVDMVNEQEQLASN